MNFLKNLFQFYVYSNIHVSISVACLVLSVGYLFNINVNDEALFMFCATFISYHLIRFLNRSKYGKKHLLDVFSNQYKILISLLVSITGLILFYELLQLQTHKILYLLPFFILTLLYAYSFIGQNGIRYSIRFIPGIKIFIIAFVWAGTIVFFSVTSSINYSFHHIIYFVSLMFFIVVLTLPFDIRDLNFDPPNIKTLPMLLGLKKVKILGLLLLMVSIMLHYITFKCFGFIPFLITSLTLFVLLLFSKEKQSKYFASFWIECIPILYYALLLIL